MQASVGTFKSHEHYEKSKAKRTYFQQVTEAYSEFREYSPVVACNYDPASPSKNSPTVSFISSQMWTSPQRQHWKPRS